MIHNIVIGQPLISPAKLFAVDNEDWEQNEKDITLFTDERFLPKLMVEAGLVNSINTVRKNKPELVKTLDKVDFIKVKWGKKFLWIAVGK